MDIKEILSNDIKFKYMLLGRLQADCEYFINTSHHKKHLWAGNIKDQIFYMKKIYKSFRFWKRPSWLSMKQIKNYRKEMLKVGV